jgi:uncharacterized RDD family membrane protein YckC
LLEDAENCSFCDAPLAETDGKLAPVPVGVAQSEEGAVSESDAPAIQEAEEPEWRREVSRRLDNYRARRRHLRPEESQTGLPFSLNTESDEEEIVRERPRSRSIQRQRQTERMEICIQPELDFSNPPDDRAHPQTALVPVAGLAERRKAAALDAFFLTLTYIGFLGLFRSLGGQFVLEKADAIVYLAAFYLFYAQYFFLFTTFAGATPGMQLQCLTIVRLDGSLPDTSQLLWRSFGYLLSGATLMLGFLWALWDEDHFTWQDRISQTYITGASPVVTTETLDVHPNRQRFAHK